MRRRLTAVFALVVGVATAALAIAVAVSQFPRGLFLLGCVLIAAVSAWYGVARRGVARVAGLIIAGVALAVAVGLVIAGGTRLVDLLVVAGLLVTLAASRAALFVHVDLPSAPAPGQAVLFFNPRSGGGKAERFALAKEARKRGIEPVELRAGDDLEAIVRGAVERGADGLAMAGGDGSQAIVAAIARPKSVPARSGFRPRTIRMPAPIAQTPTAWLAEVSASSASTAITRTSTGASPRAIG